jgi:hypothetical protein
MLPGAPGCPFHNASNENKPLVAEMKETNDGSHHRPLWFPRVRLAGTGVRSEVLPCAQLRTLKL